jgi:arylsulfatase
MKLISSVGPSIGSDHGSAVSTRYRAPFAFSGTLHEVIIELLSRADVEAELAEIDARSEMGRQ